MRSSQARRGKRLHGDRALRSVDESSRDPPHVVSAAFAGVGRGLRASDGGGSGHRPRVTGHGVGLASHAADGRARTGDRSSRLRADRRDRRSGPLGATGERTRPTLADDLAHLVSSRGMLSCARPLKSAVGQPCSTPAGRQAAGVRLRRSVAVAARRRRRSPSHRRRRTESR